jgi:hypothetical protein
MKKKNDGRRRRFKYRGYLQSCPPPPYPLTSQPPECGMNVSSRDFSTVTGKFFFYLNIQPMM